MPGGEFQEKLLKIINRYQISTTDLDEISKLISMNVEDIRVLKANYDNLMLAFEAQKEELKRSREIFENKKKEWENYKLKLTGIKSENEKDKECGERYSDQWRKSPKTPPGFWNVDFVP